jgi:hypothetical protein
MVSAQAAPVAVIQVEVDERRGLVEDFAGRGHGTIFAAGHRTGKRYTSSLPVRSAGCTVTVTPASNCK